MIIKPRYRALRISPEKKGVLNKSRKVSYNTKCHHLEYMPFLSLVNYS
jgi:hypothetical protein